MYRAGPLVLGAAEGEAAPFEPRRRRAAPRVVQLSYDADQSIAVQVEPLPAADGRRPVAPVLPLAPLEPGAGVRAAHDFVRSLSSTLVEDRPLAGDIEAVARWKPQDATTNPSLLLAASEDPRFRHLVDNAIKESRGDAALAMDWLAVQFGREFVTEVDGASVLRNLQPGCPGHLLRLNPCARLLPPFCFVGSPGSFLNNTET